MNVRIENRSAAHLPIDFERLILKLLAAVPKEHLIGLGKIVLVDRLSHKQNLESTGLYWHKRGDEHAKIEIAVSTIYKGVPRAVFSLPFVTKFMLANVLFHEIGHHYQKRIHGVRKVDEESFAGRYKKQMLTRAFPIWRSVLLPLAPLFARILKRTKERRKVQDNGSRL